MTVSIDVEKPSENIKHTLMIKNSVNQEDGNALNLVRYL